MNQDSPKINSFLIPLKDEDMFGPRCYQGLFWRLGKLHRRLDAAVKTEPDRLFGWAYDSGISPSYFTIVFYGVSGLWVHVTWDSWGHVKAEVFGIDYHHESLRNLEAKDMENVAKALVSKSFKGELKARPFYEVREEQEKAQKEWDEKMDKLRMEKEAQEQLS